MVGAGKLISLILEFGTHKKFITLENNLRLDFFSPFMGILNTTIAEGAVPIPNYLESNNFRSKTLKIISGTHLQEWYWMRSIHFIYSIWRDKMLKCLVWCGGIKHSPWHSRASCLECTTYCSPKVSQENTRHPTLGSGQHRAVPQLQEERNTANHHLVNM